MPCESSKIKRISTRREQNRRFYSDIILQVGVKSAILRFKARRRGSFFSPEPAWT
jgi:hypothetical protein